MNRPFFRPREIHAEALILVGYRLYPYTKVEMHPRLTLLSGGNGAGKTTLLDALQTILIGDQRYLHLNVAAGQKDRDLGGQLHGRIAWAALQISGHPEIAAIGAILSRRAAGDYVDLKPFVLSGIVPDQELFINPETSVILPDFRALSLNVSRRAPRAGVREFGSLNDYHRFLHGEGLLPLDLSRGGKRQFSLLWRQATQPHMGELNRFLQETLCHEPERRLTFDDVENLMRERLNAERQLNRLAELKDLEGELRSRALELDSSRRQCLGIHLWQCRRKEEELRREIEEGDKRFRQLDESVGELREELEAVRLRLGEISRERDKYLGEQGEWSRKLKHHKEYAAHRELAAEMEEEVEWARRDLFPAEAAIREVREKIEKVREEMTEAAGRSASLEQREADLNRRTSKWAEFRKDLERAALLLGRDVSTAAELEAVWLKVSEKRRNVQGLAALRQLRKQWEVRAAAYRAALDLASGMSALWPDFFEGKKVERPLLEEALARLRTAEKEIIVSREGLLGAKKPLRALIEELSKGRPPLPRPASELVEKGLAVPFASRFDALELEAAKARQDVLGPLSGAVEPAGRPAAPAPDASSDPSRGEGAPPQGEGSEGQEGHEGKPGHEKRTPLSALAQGSEPFWLVLSPEVWKQFRVLERSEHGTIAGIGGIAWYTPDGPVRIGAEARREQIKRAQERLLEIDGEVRELKEREDLLSKRVAAIQGFLPKFDALSDEEAPERTRELSGKVEELEAESPGIERLFAVVQKLFQRSELFEYADAPEEAAALAERARDASERRKELEATLKALKVEESETLKNQAEVRERLGGFQRELDRIHTVCSRLEEEEPPEVLRGEVDFGRAGELAKRLEELDGERERVQNSLSLGERRHGELGNLYRSQGEELARLRRELDRGAGEHAGAVKLWTRYYRDEKPQYLAASRPNEREHQRAAWDSLAQSLKATIAEVCAKYEISLPDEEQPDRLLPQLIELLLPPGVELESLEEQYSRLRHELQQIELKIKSHVEEIRANVESEIRRLRMHLLRVNGILSRLSFGRIRQIRLELEELPAYHAMKKLESVLRLINRSEVVTLKEFVEKLRDFILKEANVSLSEEQIADYRTYIRIRRIITDKENRVREGGLSSGETLGVNLALCLAILFFLGREQGAATESGMLLMALDEAERFDAKALETIRDLLDEVRCQLIVAMPRPVDIPDSVCHLLTPLSQGVTHVQLYYAGANPPAPAEAPEGAESPGPEARAEAAN
jgi:chromosome partition protein MukB